MGILEGQVAIVTGGGRGIGRAITRLLAREGARVLIGQRDAASGARTCQEIVDAGGLARYVPTDVAQPDQAQALVAAAVSAYGTVDILVNNAALTGVNGHLLDVSLETWERVIGANLTGVFLCSQAAARAMAPRGRGAIVSISSVNAQVPQPNCCAYAAAKGGLETLTRSMA
ncbi:MAG: SDR family NAD(P)-dependent oxidoreductase, partial [Chloroflexota bacterium]